MIVIDFSHWRNPKRKPESDIVAEIEFRSCGLGRVVGTGILPVLGGLESPPYRNRGSPPYGGPWTFDRLLEACRHTTPYCGFEVPGVPRALERPNIHSSAGEATKIELYVPTSTPTTRAKAKPWIPCPPRA